MTKQANILLREAKTEHKTATKDGRSRDARLTHTTSVSKMVQPLCERSLTVSYCTVEVDAYSCAMPYTICICLFLSLSLKS